MLDIKFIVENPEIIKDSVAKRNMTTDVDGLIVVYKEFCHLTKELNDLQAEANQIAKRIRELSGDERNQAIQRGKDLKGLVADVDAKLKSVDADYQARLLTVPNLLPDDTPLGADDTANQGVRTFMTPTHFPFPAKDHVALGHALDLIDFEGGAKVAGTKFYFIKNELVLLEFALTQFALQLAVKHGFIPLITPDICRNEILVGSGFNPRGEESNTYSLEDLDQSLIATSEIQIGGLHTHHVFEASQLPVKYVAYSHCFRREAGAAGQSSKGLYRVHQFSKVELYQFTHPEQSEAAHLEILALEESIYQALKIPYQVMRICAGDLGSPAYSKWDIEAWMPGKGENGEYGEVTSTSNCTDFQSRRLNVKFKDSEGNKHFVHTLNGTAVALSRTVVAIMENYQQADGSIRIPEVLKPFMGGIEQIGPR